MRQAKPKTPDKTEGELHAIHDGTIAGLPAEFERVLAGLNEINRRCAKVGLQDMAAKAAELIPAIERQWREVDAMIPRGPAIKKPVTVEPVAEMELI